MKNMLKNKVVGIVAFAFLALFSLQASYAGDIETVSFKSLDISGLSAADYVFWRVYICNNNSECDYYGNYTIQYGLTSALGRTAPIIKLESPAGGTIDEDGAVTFNLSFTSTDAFTSQGGNITIWINRTLEATNASYAVENIKLFANATCDLLRNTSFDSCLITTTTMFGGAISDNIRFIWSARGMNNATNLSIFASPNRTLSIVYHVNETTKPKISISICEKEKE